MPDSHKAGKAKNTNTNSVYRHDKDPISFCHLGGGGHKLGLITG
jgi:hypothetical protein